MKDEMKFKEGQEVEEIWFPNDGDRYISGKYGVEKIVVSMEPGNGALVPWLNVYRLDGVITKVNAAYVEMVNVANKPISESGEVE